MRLTILFLCSVALAPAQFLSFEIEFEDSGCVSCTESLEGRLERVRGVDEVEIDLERGLIRLELADSNRVRLGPLRARITQDGTKIRAMRFTAKGVVEERGGRKVFIPAGLSSGFPLKGDVPAGSIELRGSIADEDGALRIEPAR